MATKLRSLSKSWTKSKVTKFLKSKEKSFEGNVAAIDFGTTFCSLAYCVTGCDIETFKIDDYVDRVPTAILLKRRDQNEAITVDKIGFVAQQKYKDLPADKHEHFLYFECFKMQLRDENVSTVQHLHRYINFVYILMYM